MKYIIAIGIFQAMAAAVLLWRSKIRNHADGLLIMLVVSIALHLSVKFFIYTFVKDIAVLSTMNTFIGFCYLPLLYLYTLKILRPDFMPASRWYMFLPFIAGAIGFFSVISALSAEPDAGHTILYWYNTISFWTLIPLDILLACWVIKVAIERLPKQSNERKLIVQIGALFLLIGMLSIIFVLLKPVGFASNYLARSIVYSILLLICVRIIYYRYAAFAPSIPAIADTSGGLLSIDRLAPETSSMVMPPLETSKTTCLQVADAKEAAHPEPVHLEPEAPMPEKRKELLGIEEMQQIVQQLETAMDVKRYYTDNELTLDKLSQLTQQNKYHVSEALNHYLHKPFYTFINEYRIRHVKDKLGQLSQKNIEINMLTLAYDAGFNSKSSFNRYFKEITGQTPTEYFRKLSQSIELSV